MSNKDKIQNNMTHVIYDIDKIDDTSTNDKNLIFSKIGIFIQGSLKNLYRTFPIIAYEYTYSMVNMSKKKRNYACITIGISTRYNKKNKKIILIE